MEDGYIDETRSGYKETSGSMLGLDVQLIPSSAFLRPWRLGDGQRWRRCPLYGVTDCDSGASHIIVYFLVMQEDRSLASFFGFWGPGHRIGGEPLAAGDAGMAYVNGGRPGGGTRADSAHAKEEKGKKKASQCFDGRHQRVGMDEV